MNEHTQKLLDKSLDVLEAAEALLKIGKIDVAAGRAYYSMMQKHCYLKKKICLLTNTVTSTRHMDCISQRPKSLTQNFIAGCWMLSTSELLGIMM